MVRKATTQTRDPKEGPRVCVRFSIPQALYDGLLAGATERNQSVSLLVRDWLLWQCSPDTQRFQTLGADIANGIERAWIHYQDPEATIRRYAEELARREREETQEKAERQEAQDVPDHAKMAAEVRRQYPYLNLTELAQLMYAQGIYRAKDPTTGQDMPVNPVQLSLWLREAGEGKHADKGPPDHIKRIAEARAQHPELSIEAFSTLLHTQGIYSSTSRSGEPRPVDKSTLGRWLRQAIRAGILS
jgi:hypothetical protein